MNAKLTFVHALSPLHAGTGQGVGVIDLPIAREKATGLPFLPGSSLKGTLRDLCTEAVCTREKKEAVFGPETANAADYAGSAQFSDQRLLLLPIRSLKGTFAWVTSPYVLQRFVRDASGTPTNNECFKYLPALNEDECAVSDERCSITYQDKVILEDLDLKAKKQPGVTQWAGFLGAQVFPGDETWQDYLKARLCVVADDVFNFLLNTATEITARIKLLEDKKTVQKGGLWYEEALPAETILSGLLVPTEIKQGNGRPRISANEIVAVVRGAVTSADQPRPVQLGGKATVGRGFCYVHLAQEVQQ